MIEKLFLILFPYITYTGDAKVVMDRLVELIETECAYAVKEQAEANRIKQIAHDKQIHELLVAIALANPSVYENAGSKKITAIKNLRYILGFQNASLKACKDAVEDERVLNHDALQALRNRLTDPELVDHRNNYGMTRECVSKYETSF